MLAHLSSPREVMGSVDCMWSLREETLGDSEWDGHRKKVCTIPPPGGGLQLTIGYLFVVV